MNSSLEEAGFQIFQSLPKVLRDIEVVQQETLLLQQQMQVVKDDIRKVIQYFIIVENGNV